MVFHPPCEQQLAAVASPRSHLPTCPHIAPLSTPQAKGCGGGWGVLSWWGLACWVGPSSWSLSFHPQSTAQAVARGPGGGWCVIHVPSSSSSFPYPVTSLVHLSLPLFVLLFVSSFLASLPPASHSLFPVPHCRLLVPVIHPTSSGSRGWGGCWCPRGLPLVWWCRVVCHGLVFVMTSILQPKKCLKNLC